MAIEAELFDGTVLEFPDGTDPSIIQSTAKRMTAERQVQAPVLTQRKPEDVGILEGTLAAGKRGIASLGDVASGLGLAATSTLGTDADTLQKMQQIKAAQQVPQVTPGTSAADIERIYEQKGLGAAAAQVPKFITEQIAQSGPQTAIPLAAGMAASPFITPVGGALVGIGVYGVQQFGNFLVRQAQEKNDPKELEVAKAALTAAGTAPLGYFADRFMLGLGSLGKKAGTEVAKELTARQLAAKVGKRVAVGATEGIIAEAPVEVLEQAMERYQAGLPVTGEEANKEYKEAFFGAAAAGGGIGGTSRGIQAYREPRVTPETIKDEAVVTAPPVEQAQTVPPISASQDYAGMLGETEGKPLVKLPQVAPVASIPMPEVLNTAAQVDQAKNVVIQNRNRATPASVSQMNQIAANPDYDLVGFSKDFGTGAPVVSGDLPIPEAQLGRKSTVTASDGRKIPIQYAVIDARAVLPSNNADGSVNPEFFQSDYPGLKAIAGNARSAGLQAAYERNTAGNYRENLANDDLHGVSSEVINNIPQPVLVRLMPKDQITNDIGDISNVASNLNLSAVEQAKNDSNRIDLAGIKHDEEGNLDNNALRGFINSMPTTEQANLIDNNGLPTKQATERLNAAIFQKAYNNDDLTRLAYQADDSEARNIIRALSSAAPQMSRLEGAGEFDIRPQLIEAAQLAVNARRNGVKLSDLVNQQDMTVDPLSNNVLQLFADNARSFKKIASSLQNLSNLAFEQTQKPAEDIFGVTPKMSREELVAQGLKPTEEGQLLSKDTAEADVDAAAKSELGGKVLFRKGNLGLFSYFDDYGGPHYGVAVGRRYWRSQSYLTNGKNGIDIAPISPEEKVMLQQKVDAIEAADAIKHVKTPFIKFQNGIAISGGVSKNVANVVRGWKNLLDIKANVYISTKDFVEKNKDNFTGPHRDIQASLGPKMNGSMKLMSDGSYYVVFKESTSPTKMLETIAHELGHVHQKEVFVNATPEMQNKLQNAHLEWLSSQKNATAKELLQTLRAKTTAQTTIIRDPKMMGRNLPPYWTSFSEWYADQVARWSVSSEKPLTVVDKFFAKLGAALRKFYETLKGQKYLPNETFKQYLDEIASRMQFESFAEAKAPKGQMALFSKGELEKFITVNDQEMDQVHNAQRYGTGLDVVPEDMMHWKLNYGINHSGKFQDAAEHIGDLVHRLSSTKDNQGGGYKYGIEAALSKASRRYDFKDMLAQVRRNAEAAVKDGEIESIEAFENEFKKAAKRYADAYEKVPVYTKFQELGRDAAIALGELNFSKVQRILNELSVSLEKPNVEEKYFEKIKKEEAQFSRSKVEAEGPNGIEKLNKIRRNYRGEVVSPTTVFSIPDDSKMERFIYKIQDKYIDTKRVIQAIIAQGKEITDKWNAYLKEELYHGRTAKRTKDFLNNELLPVVRTMRDKDVSIVELDTYLQARHAEERNKQIAKINPEFLEDGTLNPNAMLDGGSGMFTKEAQDYLNNLPPEKAKVLEGLAGKIDAIVKGTQQVLIDAGLEAQSTIDIWNKTYKKYVPLMRKDLDFAQDYTGLGQGFQTRGGASKRAFGSFKEVADIFANIANQRERAIVRAEKARVGTALYGLAIMNPNPDFWLPVNPDAIKNEKALLAELRKLGINEADAANIIQEPQTAVLDPDTGTVTYKVNPILRNSPNVFAIRINGQERFIFFNASDPRAMRMVQAIKNLDAEEMGWALGNAAKVTRWIASVNTQYNPVFGAYNFIRDTLGAQFNLSTTAIAGKQAQVTAGVFPALYGIYSDLRTARAGKGVAKGEWAKLWEEYQKEGGATGYRDQFSKNRSDQNIIEKEMRNLEKGNIKKGVAAVFNWLSDYNDAMENAVRLSAYKVAITPKDKGGGNLSKEQAASIAKNLTVNFNRKGERAQQMGALYAFYNASVQGTARLAETLRGPAGKKIVAGGLLLGSVQALALAMMGFKDDEPPEFIKARNLVIPFPDGHYFAIPMPLGLHIIPNMGRITTEMVMNGGKNVGKKAANLTGVLMDAFNPIGNAGLSMQSLSPTMLDPIAAIIENKDTFGRPIAREDRATNPTPGYTRARETASYLGKELSYFLNLASGGTKYQKGLVSPTPDQIDFLFGQATGGIGREISKTEQAVTAAVTGEELPTYKVPLVGKFYGDVNSQAAQANRFYDNITRMANYENEIKGRQKDRAGTADFLRDHPEARLWQQANRLENEVSKINREKKDLLEKNAPAARIKQLEDRKTRVMTQFNNQVERLEK